MDLDETWLLHSICWYNSQFQHYNSCIASELEPTKKWIFQLNPWYLINDNFEHNQFYDP